MASILLRFHSHRNWLASYAFVSLHFLISHINKVKIIMENIRRIHGLKTKHACDLCLTIAISGGNLKGNMLSACHSCTHIIIWRLYVISTPILDKLIWFSIPEDLDFCRPKVLDIQRTLAGYTSLYMATMTLNHDKHMLAVVGHGRRKAEWI